MYSVLRVGERYVIREGWHDKAIYRGTYNDCKMYIEGQKR